MNSSVQKIKTNQQLAAFSSGQFETLVVKQQKIEGTKTRRHRRHVARPRNHALTVSDKKTNSAVLGASGKPSGDDEPRVDPRTITQEDAEDQADERTLEDNDPNAVRDGHRSGRPDRRYSWERLPRQGEGKKFSALHDASPEPEFF